MKTWNEFEKEIPAILDVDKEMIREKARLVSVIVRRRKMLNLTQAEVAKLAGLTQSAVARLENEAQIPRMDTLQKVAIALGLRLEFVMEHEEAAATSVTTVTV
jgi:transcriptional regulator with XRE-family HTH domain